MKFRLVVSAILGFLALPATAAHAQERGQFGLVMGYPSTIGAIWHITDRVALRPEIDFDFMSSDSDSELLPEASSRLWAFGASALFYGPSRDNVRTYFSPRLTFASQSTEFNGIDQDGPGVWGASGSFGAQYSPVRRFSVFGEAGLAYTRTSSEMQGPADEIIERTSSSVGVRTAVGVVIYFGR